MVALLTVIAEVPTVAAGAEPNVTANLVLGQDDLLHNGFNLVDSGSLFTYVGQLGAGVATDGLGHVYVSDNGNSRVLGWRNLSALVNGQGADLVLGQTDFLSSYCNQYAGGWVSTADTLCYPSGLAVDSSGNLYVADRGNHRVLEYNTPFDTCDSFPCVGPVADLVFGQGSSGNSFDTNGYGLGPTGLNDPMAVAVDGSGNVYIADYNNSRVLEFNDPLGSTPPNVTANLVFGQGSSGTSFYTASCADGESYYEPAPSATGMCFPTGVTIDRSGHVYIADYNNNRVLEFNEPLGSRPNNVTADVVFGQGSNGNDFTTRACSDAFATDPHPSTVGLCDPTDVHTDASGNVYIADFSNHRVLEYNNPLGSTPPNVTADLVFGQGASGNDFTSNNCTGPFSGGTYGTPPSATGLCNPEALTIDSADDLWVFDNGNTRVVKYTAPLTTDVTADLVLGQPDFTHNQLNRTKAQGLFEFGFEGQPDVGVAADAFGHLYVVDYYNNRVLGWRNSGALVSGQPADLVIGQPAFSSYLVNQGANNPTAKTLFGPVSVGVDGAGNLYVGDYRNSRVLEYTAPFSACKAFPCVGGAANIVFGIDATGKNFTTAGKCSTPSATNLCQPSGIAIDASGNVYISDYKFNRVLEYNNPLGSNPPNVTADLVFGVDSTGKNFTSLGCPTISATSICFPTGIALDASGNLYATDTYANRVMEFNKTVGSNPPNVTANLVFGVDSTGKKFTSGGSCGDAVIGFCPPGAVALDAGGNLYVTDDGYNRVLEYNNPLGSNPPNLIPNLVFGQGPSGTDFTSSACSNGQWGESPLSATGLCYPAGLAVDTSGNLYAVDMGNNRVVVYDQPLGVTPTPPSPTPTSAGTPTITATPTPTATPSPIPTADAMLMVGPKSIGFPAQLVLGNQGTYSDAKLIVLRNPKSSPRDAMITIGSITTTDRQFEPNSTCNVLPPGSHCWVAVTFTPNAIGPQRGTISIASNARNGVQTVSVRGKGRQGVLAYRPQVLDFGEVAVGTTSGSRTVTLINHNPLSMNISQISVSDSEYGASQNCVTTFIPLAPNGGSCQVTVTFTPTTKGRHPAKLSIADDAAHSPQNVNLVGRGK